MLFFLLISLPLLFVSSQNAGKKICQTKECLAAAKNLKESMNFDVDPCDDFYKYACGNFSTVHSDLESSTDLRSVENTKEILDFLKQNNSNDEPEAVHKARQFFHLCMNKDAYNDDLNKIDAILQRIGLLASHFPNSNGIEDLDYVTTLARAAKLTGVNLYFTAEVIPNPYDRTVNVIKLKVGSLNSDIPTGMRFVKWHKSKITNKTTTKQNYVDEATKRICKNNNSKSCQRLLPLLDFATNLKTEKNVTQKSEISEIDPSEPNSSLNSSIPVIYTLKQLQALTDGIAVEVNATIPTLNWTRYIEEIFTDLDNVTLDLSDPNKMKVSIKEFDSFKDAIQLIHKIQNTTTISYELLLEVVYTLLRYVDSQYYNTERDCADLTTEVLSMAVSYVYTTKEKYIKTKTEIRTMFEHIRESFQQLIQQSTWMDEKTRQRALQKLRSLKSFIAYPSIIKTTPGFLSNFYRDVKITNNLYDTMIPIIQNEITKELRKINQINDPRKNQEQALIFDWSLSPTIVNAYYVPEENTIVIPAAILDFPFNNNGLYALDYGSTGGSTLGHELTHAFDNLGRRYNEIGNIEDWWQPETANLYREKARCFVKAYDNYSLTLNDNITITVNGKNTLGENLSDNIGFKESLLAYRKYVSVSGEEPLLSQFENFNHEQLFILAYANGWCTNPSSHDLKSIKSDSHSVPEFRVNGVLQNSKEFSEIWKCPTGSKMNPSSDKCEIW